MPYKYLKMQDLLDSQLLFNKGEITYSRQVEILNEIIDSRVKAKDGIVDIEDIEEYLLHNNSISNLEFISFVNMIKEYKEHKKTLVERP